jgi:hypothetical protein
MEIGLVTSIVVGGIDLNKKLQILIKDIKMKTLTIIMTLIGLLMLNNICYANSSEKILWNEECPSAVSDDAKERQNLKKEFPDFEAGLGLLLDIPNGKKISEPNESLQKEINLNDKIVKEVFKPGIVPLESLKDKFLIADVNISKKNIEQVLIFRVKQEKYIIQFMKFSHSICVTIRPTSGKTIDIPQIAEDIFNKRILPLKMNNKLSINSLKRDSKILKAGFWRARDTDRITPSGKGYSMDQFTAKPERLPIGEGLYGNVTYYTNNKFAIFAIVGGPKILSKDVPGYPGSAGTGDPNDTNK